MASVRFARLAAKRLLLRPTTAPRLGFNGFNGRRAISTTEAGGLKTAAEYQKTTLTEDIKSAGAYEYGFASTMKPKELTSGFIFPPWVVWWSRGDRHG